MATRNGSAEWKGDLKGGSGTVRVGEGVFEGDYSFTSRFEEGEGTNPEELIAAAHAACFAMALSGIIGEAGHSPESIEARAAVHLRNVDGQPTIARIELTAEGSVPRHRRGPVPRLRRGSQGRLPRLPRPRRRPRDRARRPPPLAPIP